MQKFKSHNYIRQENKTFGRKMNKVYKFKSVLRWGRKCNDCGVNISPCHYVKFRCKECQYKSFLKTSREKYSRKHICKNCGEKATVRSKDYCKVCDNTIRPRGIANTNFASCRKWYIAPSKA